MRIAHLALIVSAAIAVTACSSGSDDEAAGTNTQPSNALSGWNGPAARDACHDKVQARLVSPSTADFEGLFDANMTQGLAAWTISGHVDSQNGFGATVRSEYACTVTPQGPDSAMVAVDYLTQR